MGYNFFYLFVEIESSCNCNVSENVFPNSVVGPLVCLYSFNYELVAQRSQIHTSWAVRILYFSEEDRQLAE